MYGNKRINANTDLGYGTHADGGMTLGAVKLLSCRNALWPRYTSELPGKCVCFLDKIGVHYHGVGFQWLEDKEDRQGKCSADADIGCIARD